MAQKTDEEKRFVVTELAMLALEALADGSEQSRARIRYTVKAWFPDVDEFDMRHLVSHMEVGVQDLRAKLSERRDRMIVKGDVRDLREH